MQIPGVYGWYRPFDGSILDDFQMKYSIKILNDGILEPVMFEFTLIMIDIIGGITPKYNKNEDEDGWFDLVELTPGTNDDEKAFFEKMTKAWSQAHARLTGNYVRRMRKKCGISTCIGPDIENLIKAFVIDFVPGLESSSFHSMI